MNDSDPIVDEVRRIRDAHAAKFNYDPKAIFRDIKEREKRSGRKYVSFVEDKIEPKQGIELNQPLQPNGPATTVSDNIPSQQAGSAAER
jgi:hypothetical protein